MAPNAGRDFFEMIFFVLRGEHNVSHCISSFVVSILYHIVFLCQFLPIMLNYVKFIYM